MGITDIKTYLVRANEGGARIGRAGDASEFRRPPGGSGHGLVG